MPKVVIEVRDLRYAYPDGVEALRGVDFTLHEGETVAVFGANGSGKTTFLSHLVGLLQGQGTVKVCGLEVNRENLPAVRQRVGMLFQDSDDQLFMPTVEEEIAFGPLNLGLDVEEVERRIESCLSDVGLSEFRRRAPHHLSAGQKRRAALAGVLAMQPEIILLDEPATFLDPPAKHALVSTLKKLPQAKILVTHDPALAESLATRAVFFEQGCIVAEGTVQELTETHAWR